MPAFAVLMNVSYRTPIPANEAERIRALYEYQILDTLPELNYDDLTRLAAVICGCPFSIITFVDHDRQWFKSIKGLKAKETPREGGFCAHAIVESELFTVQDATLDQRFREHPLVVGSPNIKFYAAAPVRVGKDLNIGVICVIDSKPRVLEPFQIEALKALSRMVAVLLENRKQYYGLREAFEARKEAEKLLIYSSKMAALGEMSAGISHEINNPLAIIQGRAEQLAQNAENEKLDQKQVALIARKIDAMTLRISQIIKSLRSFARECSNDPFQYEEMSSILESTLELCKSRFQENATELRLPSVTDGLKLECRAGEISQVILNLLNNAFDAVVGSDKKWVELEVREESEWIEIHVVDSGLGIPEAQSEKIMQPFFTTKEVGKGTGLGLSISKGIVESHGGTLRFVPESQHTRFVVRLPKYQRALKKMAA